MSSLNSELASLSDSSKKEIAAYLDAENSKQKVRTSINQFTDICFRKCVDRVDSGDLSQQEEQCLSSCVNRFLDTNIRIVRGLQGAQQ
ncbi:Mitochondrial import inner membrane translocase subunit TIM8 [Nakaseomyces bracarensis]|uniref:Mitochondrial import inner membrane translocase subunit n=1 Tax=Nakaseomyces bracarensis TaxID=273131 RepID=A0ABR4NSX6_9SACH